MSTKTGQTVKVNPGQQDPDTGISIAGWSGRVINHRLPDDFLEIEWDSPTLLQMPDTYIRHSIDGGYDCFRYHIEASSVEIIEPQDAPEQTLRVQKDMKRHYRDYELSGRRPTPFSSDKAEEMNIENPKLLKQIKTQLFEILKTIKGSGSFVASGVSPLVHPGLRIENIGEIGLPITTRQATEIIGQAIKAPFGKGSKTITDTTVRNTWEIDTSQLQFDNVEWEDNLLKIVAEVKNTLGIEEPSVKASLYKLLIYEPGSFFLPHQDSEKEKGMFGTLVIGLPAKHTGGELVIRFDGREEVIDFSHAASNYKIPYTAFYADCEHEVKPIISGYRVCLVYNLLQSTQASSIRSPQFSSQIHQMSKLIKQMTDITEWKPMSVLLDHQYTPSNYSLPQLKLHDRPRANALMEAAEKADYFASLGLVTLYQSGELAGTDFYNDYSYNRRYYEKNEERRPSGGTMGEIYQQSLTVEHWGESDMPGIGEINIKEEDILTQIEIGEGNPIEQQEEGYTGNAGMTIDYWYHYGAVILWPKTWHFNLLVNKAIPVKLEWLEYYLKHWNKQGINTQESSRKLILRLSEDTSTENERYTRYDSVDFSPVASGLVKLQDKELLMRIGKMLLPVVFTNIRVDNWVALIQNYDPSVFHPIFEKVAEKKDVYAIRHLLNVISALNKLELATMNPFILHHINRFPDYLTKSQLQKLEVSSYWYFSQEDKERRIEASSDIVENVLELSIHKEKDAEWIKKVLESLVTPLHRDYLHEVLAPILLSEKNTEKILTNELYRICINDLEKRTDDKPLAPTDWKRETPKSKDYQHLWDLLHPFLSSPTQSVFDYVKNQSYRSEMERAINNATVDLKMETIKIGSPHMLRLIKTHASYNKALKEWKEDMELLKRMREVEL